MSGTKSPSAGEYVNVASNLYRHSKSGRYYGVKKVGGKRKERSLQTSDRALAERRLKEWLANLSKLDSEVEKTTLRQLLERFEKVYMGKSEKTREDNGYILKRFRETWPHGLNIQVREIRVSYLDEWLASFEASIKHTTYNRYVGFLRQVFEIAVKDRIIVESPVDSLATKWKRPQPPKRVVPTVPQFEAIIADIRGQKFTNHSKSSGDFLEFLGLAGLGQAEAAALVWGDVDFDSANPGLSIKRQKTHQRFHVPMYPHLRPFMERMRKKAGKVSPGTKVFKIKDGKKALSAGCKRLGLPAFSQRNLRQCLIRRLWEAGVDVKLISKWQGHNDGGKLILDTYTEVFGAQDRSYVAMQLAKLE